MIVVDTSAFVAIFRQEPDADLLSRRLSLAESRTMSAATYLECVMVVSRYPEGRAALDDWLLRRGIAIEPVDHTLARAAADAFERYGKGRHPAGLDFGDCFSYALAQARAAPLPFKGDDFARTDVRRPPP